MVHVHVSDRLVDDAPHQWSSLVEWTRDRDVPLVVTLHDVPQPQEGVERHRRRSAAFRRIARSADLVVVSSRSEQNAAAEIGVRSVVVDHPIFPVAEWAAVSDDAGPARRSRTITVAGFVHPGKGVAEMLDAIGDVRGTAVDGWQLRLVGDASERHRDEPVRLRALANAVGLDFHHTGPLPTSEWNRELRQATVAVCPHLHCSASGSILSWIAHARRPIVTDLPFCRELADERPDALTIVRRPDEWLDRVLASAHRESPDDPTDRSWRTPARSIEQLDAAVGDLLAQRARRGDALTA